MRVRYGLAAITLTMAAAGGALVVEGPVGAIPADCAPAECVPEPEPDPAPPTGPGYIINFHASIQACEPRLTPTNYLSYEAPGATKTVISVSPFADDNFTVVQTFRGGGPVYLRHQSHGEYRIVSYKPETRVVDVVEWYTC